MTTDNFIVKSKNIYGDKYDYSLVDYIDQYTKVKIICPIHGVFEQIPKKHYNHNCKYCAYDEIKIRKGIDFIKKSKEIYDNKYDYSLVDYIGVYNEVKIICPEHGEFEQKPNYHLSGRGCSKCGNYNKGKNSRHTTKIFIEKSKKIHDNKYDYSLVEYGDNNTKKVKIICSIHGIFEQKPNYHLIGRGCPKCKNSIGESKISKILKSKNIKFEQEKRFDNCKDLIPLPFDFYLPKYNTCIEYDGIQHFKIINHWGGKEQLLYIQKHDQIKNDYCKNNEIKLIRIKYNEKVYDKIHELIKK